MKKVKQQKCSGQVWKQPYGPSVLLRKCCLMYKNILQSWKEMWSYVVFQLLSEKMAPFISLINAVIQIHTMRHHVFFEGKKVNLRCNMVSRKPVSTEIINYSQNSETSTVMDNYFSWMFELWWLRLCRSLWFESNQEILNTELNWIQVVLNNRL